MKKRRMMSVNGEQWQVMNSSIATGPSLEWFAPFRPPSKMPESIQSQKAAEKWLKDACDIVEAANAADRKRFYEKQIPLLAKVTITFKLARWHGAILLDGNRRGISKEEVYAAEIDNLQRLHLKDGLVIQGSFKDLTSDELTRHEKILSMERPAPPSLDEIRKAVKNPSNAGRKKSNPKALDALISETRKTYRHALSTKELLSQAQAADYVLKKYCRAHRIDAPYTVDYLVKKAFKEKS